MPTGSGERTLTGRIAPLNGTIGRSLRKSGRSPPIRYASGSLVPAIYIHRIDAPKMPSNWLRLWGLLFEQNRQEWGEACVVHGVGNSGGASQAEGLRLTTGLAVVDPTSRALSGEARDGLPGRGGLRRYEPGGAVGRGVSMVESVARRNRAANPGAKPSDLMPARLSSTSCPTPAATENGQSISGAPDGSPHER